jgi:hypothetical protein
MIVVGLCCCYTFAIRSEDLCLHLYMDHL